jgi:hypothetical protein
LRTSLEPNKIPRGKFEEIPTLFWMLVSGVIGDNVTNVTGGEIEPGRQQASDLLPAGTTPELNRITKE